MVPRPRISTFEPSSNFIYPVMSPSSSVKSALELVMWLLASESRYHLCSTSPPTHPRWTWVRGSTMPSRAPQPPAPLVSPLPRRLAAHRTLPSVELAHRRPPTPGEPQPSSTSSGSGTPWPSGQSSRSGYKCPCPAAHCPSSSATAAGPCRGASRRCRSRRSLPRTASTTSGQSTPPRSEAT